MEVVEPLVDETLQLGFRALSGYVERSAICIREHRVGGQGAIVSVEAPDADVLFAVAVGSCQTEVDGEAIRECDVIAHCEAVATRGGKLVRRIVAHIVSGDHITVIRRASRQCQIMLVLDTGAEVKFFQLTSVVQLCIAIQSAMKLLL